MYDSSQKTSDVWKKEPALRINLPAGPVDVLLRYMVVIVEALLERFPGRLAPVAWRVEQTIVQTIADVLFDGRPLGV